MKMNSYTSQDVLTSAKRTLSLEAEALNNLANILDEQFVGAVDRILACKGKVVITGMGKSGLIGRKIAATLASTGSPSFYLHPGEAFHGDLGMISPEDVVLALSHSGETDEVLKIVPFIHSNGNVLISITSNPSSTLAKNSDLHLNTGVKEEACVLRLAPTTSTTVQLALGDALAIALMEARQFTAMDFARLHPGGSLGRRLLMTVGNVMRSNDLPVVGPDCGAVEMIHKVSRGGLGLIIIVDNGQIIGIVTDGDIRRAMESREAEFFKIKALDIATRSPKCVNVNAKLIEAERLMTQNKVNSLLVTDDEGALCGVIQIYDIKL